MQTETKMFGGRGFTPSEQEQIRYIASEESIKKQKHLLEQMGIAGQSMRNLQEDFIYIRKQREASSEVKKYVIRSLVGAIFSGIIWVILKGININ